MKRPGMVALLAGMILFAGLAVGQAPSEEVVLVAEGTATRYLANMFDLRLGLRWTLPGFDDRRWATGTFGLGFERTRRGGAVNLIDTPVSPRAFSVFTRTTFVVEDLSTIESVILGADYDDAFAAWINGVEVFRSPELRRGTLHWIQRPQSHESSNGLLPDYTPSHDITERALPLLHEGENLLALAVWNEHPTSDDLLLVPRLALNHPPDVVRGPYLQLGTPESVVVRWRTDRPAVSRVWLGTDPGELSPVGSGGAPTTEHEVDLTDLTPLATYHYAVGDDDQLHAGGEGPFRFTAAPPVGARVARRIWALGDSGTADLNARRVADAYRAFAAGAGTDLWLMLGDNAYPAGTDEQYQAAVFDMYPDFLRSAVLWPTLGNHDVVASDPHDQEGPYFRMFTLPAMGEAGGIPSGTETYYSFDHANIHFVCLESEETNRSMSGPMLQWLEEDLAATTQDWIIAFWHHPPYSKGSHDSDLEIELIQMRENALPILEEGGVDLVLTGHSHSYERSFLLDGHYGSSRTLTPAMILDHGNGQPGGTGPYGKPAGGPLPHEGAVYVVAGSSGQLSDGELDHPVMVRSIKRLGSLVLDVSGDRLDGRFLDHQGRVRDHFAIVKTSPP